MQKFFLYTAVVLTFWIFLPNKTYASHAAGGEISYEWVSDSTYRIYFKFYRDCAGVAAPGTSVLLCFSDTCNSQSGNVYLYKMNKLPDSSNNGNPVSSGCPGTGTRCTSTTSTVPSYQEWWYTNTVTLPNKCGLWKFSVNVNARNPSGNLAVTRALYAEAQLNNLVAPGNSSPYFSVKPVPSVCINKPYTYNNGGVDPNSDSLTFEMARPLTTTGNCPPTPTIIPFAVDSPSYNLTDNPIQTHNTFSLDSTNGQMTFTPKSLGPATMSIRINEYRNNVWIGSVVRDVQVQVINCNVPSPTVSTVSTTITGATLVNGRVEACAGVQMSFCYDLKSTDTNAVLVANDNSSAATPNASVNYTGQQTDSIRGCFTWTPGSLDTGLRVFSVTVKDSSCNAPYVIIAQTFVLPIYIWPITDIVKDTSICYGDSVQLLAVGGSNFTWSVLSGGSPLSTLSCTNCKQPWAKPTTSTQYVVSNSSVQYCSKNKDTVTISVSDIRNDTLTASTNAPVCEYDTLKLYSTAANPGLSYYWTGPNGFTDTARNPVIPIPTSLDSGYYVLRSTRGSCYSNPDSISVEIKPAPDTPVATSNSPLCVGDTLKLFTPTAAGATYSWSGPNSFSDTAQNPVLLSAGTAASGNYKIYTTGSNGCSSLTDSTSVIVHIIPSIDTALATNPTTCSGTEGTVVLTGLSNSTTYTVNYKKNGVAQTPIARTSNSSGNLTVNNLGAGTYSQFTVTSNGCESDTSNSVVLYDPNAPVISVSSNSPVCQGDTIELFSTVDSSGVVWSWIGPNGFSSSAQNPQKTNAVVADSGVYYLTASKNGCLSDTDSVSVTVYSTPIVPVANSNTPVCSGDALLLTSSAIANATYYWSGPNSFTDTVQNPVVSNVQLADSGDYMVYVTVNGCTSETDTTHVSVIETPSKPTANSNTPLCDGDTLKLFSTTVSGATYAWTGPSSFSSTSQNPVVNNATPVMSGTYIVTVTQNGCGSEGDSTVVNIYAIPDTPTASNNTPICTDNTLMLFADTVSGATYSWTGPNSFSSTSQNPSISNADTSKNGVYTVIATVNGCESAPSSTTASISALPTPIISSSTVVNPTTCAGSDGKIILTGLDTNTIYIINVKKDGIAQTPDTIQTDSTGKLLLDSLAAGSYSSMTVTSPIGCTSDGLATLVLTDPTPPSISIDTTSNTTTCSGTNGSITIKGLLASTTYDVDYKKNGVAQPQQSLVSGTDGKITINNLQAATYDSISVMIINCTSNYLGPVVVNDPNAPVVSITNNTPICVGDSLKLFGQADSTGVTWNWTGPNSFSSTNQNPVITAATSLDSGWYYLTATKNNCTSIADSSLAVVFPIPAQPSASSNAPICSGSDLYLTAATVIDASYAWYGPNGYSSTTQNPVIIRADTTETGNYYLYVSVNGCTSDADTLNVVVNSTPIVSSITSSNPITCTGNEGYITLAGLLDNTTYTVDYKKNTVSQTPASITSDGSGNVVLQNLTAGTYSEITVTINNCTSLPSGNIVLSDPSAPRIVTNNNTPICEGDTIKLFGQADSTGVIWSWTGPNAYTSSQQNPIITNALPTQSGNYVLTATKNNCTSEPDTAIVTVKPTPTTPVAGSSSPVCSGVTLFLTSSSITGANYSWVGPNGFTDTVQNPVRFSSDTTMSGNYIVTVTVNGCISEADTTQVIVNQTPAIASSSYTHPTTCNGTEGTITLTGLLSNTSYDVSYNKNGSAQTPASVSTNGVGSLTVTGLSAGVYSDIRVAINNCPSDSINTITLIDPNAPVVSASNNTPVCQGGNIFLSGTADSSGVTWSWTGPGSYTSSQQSPVITSALPAQSGVYTLTATLNNCTSVADTTTVLVKPTPTTPIANSNSPLCAGNILYLTASTIANGNYQWQGPNGFSDTAQNPSRNNADTTATGDYWVYVTVDGCISATDTTTVIVHHVPSISGATHIDPTTCNGTEGSITLSGLRNGETYTVNYLKNGLSQTPLNLTANVSGNVTMSGLSAGTYAQIRVSLNGCASDTINSIVLVDPNAPIVIATNNTPICESDTIKLFAQADSSGVTWSWTGPNGYNSTTQNPVITSALPTQSGVYTLTATLNNCTSVADTTTVLVKPTPVTPAANSSSPICAGSSLFLTSSTISNATYSWTGPNSFTDTVQNPIINNADTVATGNYIVYVTVSGCESARDTTPVIVHHVPAISSTSYVNPTTCNGTEGSITLYGLRSAETYTVAYMKNGVPQSSLNITANGSGNVVMQNLGKGTYSQISVLLNGCQSDTVASIVLTDPNAPVVTATNNTPICEGFNIALTGQADSSGVDWSWTGPNGYTSTQQSPTIASAVPIQSGNYILTATLNNCTSESDTTTVVVKPTPSTPVLGSNTPVCSGNTLLLTADTIANATYAWTGPNSFASTLRNPSIANVTTAATGTYSVIATVDGCLSAAATTNVVINQTPSITSTSATNPTSCGGSDGTISLLGLDNGSTYTVNYLRNGLAQTPLSLTANTSGIVIITGLNAGVYSQMTTTINGCPSDTTAPVVIENPVAPVAHATNSTPVCEDYTANIYGTSDSTGVVWNWTGPNSFTASTQNVTFNNAQPNQTGNYILTVTKNNCTSEPDTTYVTVYATPDTPYAINNSPLCTGNTLYLDAQIIPGATYSWTGPRSFSDTSRTPILLNTDTTYSGQYIVTATVNGCVSEPDTTLVIVNPLPAPVIGGFTIGHPTTCGGSDGYISLGGMEINTSYTVNYTKDGITQTPIVKVTDSIGGFTLSNLTQGDYDSMTVTSANNGCKSNFLPLFQLRDPLAPAVVLDTFYHITTCGGTDGKIVFKGLVSGSTYSVKYTYLANPSTTISKTADSTGRVILDGLDDGNYHSISFTIYNCTTSLSNVIKLLDPDAPEVIASSNSPVCEGDSIQFSTTVDSSGATWSWIGPSGYTSTQQNPTIYSANVTNNGIYTVTATKNNCTSIPDTVAVNVIPTPNTPLAGSNSPICAGSTLTLTANSFVGADYTWTGPNGFSDTTQNPVINNADTAASGLYIVYTTVLGCTSLTSSISVQVNEIPTFDSVGYINPTTCTGVNGSISLYGLRTNENYTINYFKNGVAQSPQVITTNSAGVLTLSSLNAGLYTQLTVTRNSCASDTTTPVLLIDPNAPVVTASNNTPICEGDTLKLFGQADSTGVTWSWSGPNSYTSNTQNPVLSNAFPVQSGVYTLTATKNNCTSVVDSTTVLVKPNPTTPIAGSNTPLCNGDSLSLTASSVTGATYTWSGPNSFSDTQQNTSILNVTPSVSGWYYVFTTLNGCVSEKDSTQVNVYPIPSITGVTFSNPTTCGGTQGSITVAGLTNGTSYIINYKKNGVAQTSVNLIANSSGTVTITGLGAGTYDEITATIVACTSNKVGPVVLSDPNAPVVTATNGTPICQGDTIKLFGQANVSGVTWSWTGPGGYNSATQNPIITNALPSQAGDYYLTATRNNCTSNPDTTYVTVYPTPPTPTVNNNSPLCTGDSLILTASAISNAKYHWSGPNGFSDTTQNTGIGNVSPSISGNYSVYATVNGCVSPTGTTVVTVNSIPTAPVVTAFVFYCQDDTANALTATGQNLLWYTASTGGTGSSTAIVPPTNTAGVTDYYVSQTVNGCESPRAKITVTIHPRPVPPTATPNAYTYCQNETATQLNATGINLTWYIQLIGGPSYTTAPTPVTNTLGNFNWYVTETNSFGCESDKAKITVSVIPNSKLNITTDKDEICIYDSLTVENTSIINGANYLWNYGGGNVLSNNGNSAYTLNWNSTGVKTIQLQITNLKCIEPDTVSIVVNEQPSASFIASANEICLGEEMVFTANQVSGAVYIWSVQNSADSTNGSTYPVTWNSDGAKMIKLKVVSAEGCESEVDSQVVNVHEQPNVSITAINAEKICTNDTIQIVATENADYTYLWSSANTLLTNETYSITARITQPSYIYLDVTDKWNCTAKDSVFVASEACCKVFFPNSFTPNNDGRNDRFKGVTAGHQSIIKFVVVNRWGTKVFESTSPSQGWDGTLNGVQQDVGTYNYYIKYRCSDGSIHEHKGDVVLIR